MLALVRGLCRDLEPCIGELEFLRGDEEFGFFRFSRYFGLGGLLVGLRLVPVDIRRRLANLNGGGHLVILDIKEAAGDGVGGWNSLRDDLHLACNELAYNRGVTRQNAQLAFGAGKNAKLHFSAEHFSVGGYDVQLK